jgi:hypothetical protein
VTAQGRERGVVIALRVVAVGLGALQAWTGRNAINADGISYLDIADAYARADWVNAISAYWSPLYSWLLLGALALGRLVPASEFRVAHALNFAIYAAAIVSLEFLLRGVQALHRARTETEAQLPEWAWPPWGYAVFIPAALGMVSLRPLTPDLMAATVIMLAAGLLCRLAVGDDRVRTLITFGVVLALGYLTKAVLFPFGIVAIAVASAVLPRGRRLRIAVAVAAFVALSLPLVAAVSARAGHLTFGETGRLNHTWFVLLRDHPEELRPVVSALEPRRPLLHPPRKLMDTPAVYEFASPVPGTLPLWYDPVYWNAGGAVPVTPRAQLAMILDNLSRYGALLRDWTPSLAGLAVLLSMGRPRSIPAALGAVWCVIVPALVTLAAYSLINVEGRYVAGCFVLLFVAAFAAVRLAGDPVSRRLLAAVCATAFALQVAPVAAGILADAGREVTAIARGDWTVDRHRVVAQALADTGVQAGEGVAVIGDYFSAGWARLARVRIVAVVDDHGAPASGGGGDTVRARVLTALAHARVRTIVSEGAPRPWLGSPWTQLGPSNFYVFRPGLP